MQPFNVYLELGSKKVFAGALEWPGWCRSGRDETAALQALLDYGARYARVMQEAGLAFAAPADLSGFTVIERLAGTTTTDFGAPDAIPQADRVPVDRAGVERLQSVLVGCWQAFDTAVQRAAGKTLRKGPRGGGRDIAKMTDHVREAERAYLGQIAWKAGPVQGADALEALNRVRQAVREALEAAANGGLPAQRPRGGEVWPVPYFVRRAAWHVLDHVWEIEDRVE